MTHKKIDLVKHMPQHPVIKTLAVVFALVGLTGLVGSLTHADLQIQSTINNVISTFQELRISTDGSSQGTTKVILNSGGIWVDSGSLGGPAGGVLKVNSQGYFQRGLISGSNIADNSISGLQIMDGSITTGKLAFTITGSAGSGGGSTTLSCPNGETLIGVSGGVGQCTPIIGTGDCSGSGGVAGWSNTGLVMCNNGQQQLSQTGASLWHLVSGSQNIYYGTLAQDYDGNVGIGLNIIKAKLHVAGSFRVDTTGIVLSPTAGVQQQYELTNLHGFYPQGYCNSGVDCYMSTAYLPQVPSTGLRAIEVLGSTVNTYVIDPMGNGYHWIFNATYPRCSCDLTNSSTECSSPHYSSLTDNYCLDVAVYSGPPVGNPPYTQTPIDIYTYNGNTISGTGPALGASAGLITKAARVGINTFQPGAALDVVGNVRFSSYAGTGIRNLGVTANGDVVIVPTLVSSYTPYWLAGTTPNSIYYNGGNVGIGTATPSAKLHVNGDIITNAVYISSDATLKTNITPITNALSKVLSLSGYYFTWKLGGKNDIGVLAQEVEGVFPQIVKTDEAGIKAVEYPNLIAVVIQAIKELNTLADDLNAKYADDVEINDLLDQYRANEATLTDLETRITALEGVFKAHHMTIGDAEVQGIDICDAGDNPGYSSEDNGHYCDLFYTRQDAKQDYVDDPTQDYLRTRYEDKQENFLLFIDYLFSVYGDL